MSDGVRTTREFSLDLQITLFFGTLFNYRLQAFGLFLPIKKLGGLKVLRNRSLIRVLIMFHSLILLDLPDRVFAKKSFISFIYFHYL